MSFVGQALSLAALFLSMDEGEEENWKNDYIVINNRTNSTLTINDFSVKTAAGSRVNHQMTSDIIQPGGMEYITMSGINWDYLIDNIFNLRLSCQENLSDPNEESHVLHTFNFDFDLKRKDIMNSGGDYVMRVLLKSIICDSYDINAYNRNYRTALKEVLTWSHMQYWERSGEKYPGGLPAVILLEDNAPYKGDDYLFVINCPIVQLHKNEKDYINNFQKGSVTQIDIYSLSK
ncbi:hypothetical protein C7M52_02487 [Mixta theicola]|nr:hypothetical protein C7M52_02487 [Mixta theicola]